jgi:2-polyprenyl-6-hydroxyphenyl methylase/3-demethylubiquinone-9 3-methyltransferase
MTENSAAKEHYSYATTESVWDDQQVFAAGLRQLQQSLPKAKTIFELGCGNGLSLKRLSSLGYQMSAIEAFPSGVAMAQQNCPQARVELGRVEEDLAARFGQFDALWSMEVIEHIFSARSFAQCCWNLVKPGGCAIISTPYHGYWKNLAIAALGKFDRHVDPLWEYGHIKFYSRATLVRLFAEQGFELQAFARIGRIPVLAKSMVACFRKPGHAGVERLSAM